MMRYNLDRSISCIKMNCGKFSLAYLLIMVITALGNDSHFAPFLCPSSLFKDKFAGISIRRTNSCLTVHSPAVLGIRSPDPTLDYLQRAEKFCSEAYSGHNGTFQWTKYMLEHNIKEMSETFDNMTSFFLLWPGNLSFKFDHDKKAYTPEFTSPCSTCPARPFSSANFSTEMSVRYKASEDLIASVMGNEAKKLCFSFNVFQPTSQHVFACDEYFQWDAFACYHTRFDPCEETTDCQFDRQTNLCTVKRSRWSWLFKISCTRQKPVYAADINCPCDPCRNSEWSKWSSVDVACGRAIKRRYRVKTGRVKKRCGDDDDDCCYDRMVVDLGSCGRHFEEKGARDQNEQDEKAMKNAIIVLGASLAVLVVIVIGAKLGTKKSKSRKGHTSSPEMSQQEKSNASTRRSSLRRPSRSHY